MNFAEGYVCDKVGRVVPSTARVLNLKELMNIYKSTDPSVFENNQWVWDGKFRFLDGEKIDRRLGFTSYPRSGNSFLRRYVEQLTGIVTGSNVSIHTGTSLQIMGLMGEAHMSDICWVTKSHHPFAMNGRSDPNPVHKTFMCVRHPLDVFPSFASLLNTVSHGNKIDFDLLKDYPEWWDWYVKKQSRTMKRWFDTIIRHCVEENRQPLYIVRYEDLVMEPKETLMGLMSFLLDEQDLTGTTMERRIDQLLM